MPFRSDIEHVKEQLRRAEERVHELEEEKERETRKLEAEAELPIAREPPRSRLWLGVIGIVVAGGVTYILATTSAAAEQKRLEAEMVALMASEKRKTLACESQLEKLERDLRGPAKTPLEIVPTPTAGEQHIPCGDPLCLCLDRLDTAAAVAAFDAVDVTSCKRPGGPTGTGHVTVTFAPTGYATSTVVDTSPFAGTPEGACIADKFRSARIPPFSGAPVHLGRSFTID